MPIITLTSLDDAGELPAVNASGLIAGTAEFPGTAPGSYTEDVAVWQNSNLVNLGIDGHATAINAAGQVAGYEYSPYSPSVPTYLEAFVWQAGTATILPGLITGQSNFANGLNASGDVVGQVSSGTASAPINEAALWHKGQLVTLGFLPGGDTISGGSSAAAINDAGQIVGSSGVTGGASHAFLWQNGTMTDLGVLNRLRKNSTPNRWRDRVTYDSIMWRGFLPEGHRCAGRINERTACFLM